LINFDVVIKNFSVIVKNNKNVPQQYTKTTWKKDFHHDFKTACINTVLPGGNDGKHRWSKNSAT